MSESSAPPKTAREVAMKNLAKAWKSKKRGRGKKPGVREFLTTGGVSPAGKEHIARRVDALVFRMAEELGGVPALSGQQLAVLWSQRTCLTIMMLACEHLQAAGLIGEWTNDQGKRVSVNPVVAMVGAYADRARRNAQVLGLEKRVPGTGETIESITEGLMGGGDTPEVDESQVGEDGTDDAVVSGGNVAQQS